MKNSSIPKKPITPRAAAVRQLNRVEADQAFVGLVGGSDEGLDPRGERQVTEYVAGVTRWRRWLDFLIDRYYRGRADQLEQTLRQILRIGLYDLLFLDTPPHAALNEAVDLAKRMVRPGAGGLVNGLLRSVQRARNSLPRPRTGDAADDLAIRYSHPTWMVQRWMERFGTEATTALLQANNARPVYGVRINTGRVTPEAFMAALDEHGVAATPSPYLDDFVRVQRLQPLLRAGLLEQGWCAVQDEAAGLAVRLLDPRPGETVIDTCAAPGGKALYAAGRMAGAGVVRAFDVNPVRLRLVAEAAAQHGLETMVVAEAADVATLAAREDPPTGDRVLLDAPCSGLGVLAKRADLRWRRPTGDLSELTHLQDVLLDAAAALVRPGGLLLYSTCTLAPEENEERVAAFLDRHDAFTLERADGLVPPEMVTPDGFYTALPHVHGIDGAFGARLRRRP